MYKKKKFNTGELGERVKPEWIEEAEENQKIHAKTQSLFAF